MKLKDAKIGDRVRVPYNGSYVLMDFDRTKVDNYFVATILEKERGMVHIGWSAGVNRKSSCMSIGVPLSEPLKKQFPKLHRSQSFNPDVACEIVSRASANSTGFLLACIGAGVAANHFLHSNSQSEHLNSK